MERNFNNEFERFLKESADQYRLYPSAHVWKGVYSALHSRRKWFGLGIVLLLITGTLVTILITHSSKQTAISTNKTNRLQKAVPTAISVQPVEKTVALNNSRNSSIKILTEGVPGISSSRLYDATADNLIGIRDYVNNNSVNNFSPLSYNLTDELTDQDMAGTMSSHTVLDYSNMNRLTPSRLFDWTIESVLNSFNPTAKDHKKFSLQFNFTPTISYRKLSGNNSFLNSSASRSNATYAPLYDINSVVTHKPDMGLEFGLTEKYSVASNFKVKAGLQFNINRYDIKAFNYPFEVAKIALRGSSGVDSFYTISTHRNYGGYKSDWLQNFYFEISVPIGIELNLMGDDKVQFGVAGSIQPTYVLGDRAYLLSTDYKNYALVPWLIRRWNANTALETFVSYSTGKMKWQVGPQVRYQLLSSFIDKYPVKENLFDFGLKVGISVNK
jgi:hypothetical protein